MTRLRTAKIAWCLALLVAGATLTAEARGQRGRGPQGPPDIAGKWTGTWSSFNPVSST